MNQCAHSEDDDDDCKLSGTGATKAMEWSQRDKKNAVGRAWDPMSKHIRKTRGLGEAQSKSPELNKSSKI